MFHRLLSLVSLSLLLLTAGPTAAQEEATLAELVTVEVRPGAESLFEEFVAGIRMASMMANMENYWLTSQSVTGPPVYRFTVQHGSFASFGQNKVPFVEMLGEEATARLFELAQQSVRSVHRAFYQSLPDLSVARGETDRAPDAVNYSFIELNPGMAQQYLEVTRYTREASSTLFPDAAYFVNAPGPGAEGRFLVVGIIESWSDLDTPLPNPGERVIQHFGQERGSELVGMAQEAISGIEVVLARTRPDLNYQPEE